LTVLVLTLFNCCAGEGESVYIGSTVLTDGSSPEPAKNSDISAADSDGSDITETAEERVTLVGAAPSPDEEPVIIIAGSDFQNPESHTKGLLQVKAITDRIRDAGYDTPDAFFFCGDYTGDFEGSRDGFNALNTYIRAWFPSLKTGHMVMLQGNHDFIDIDGLSPAGSNDPHTAPNNKRADEGRYGVFVIHEADYDWYNDERERTEAVGKRLREYLDAKLAEGFTRPIFILSHLQLHCSMRTYLQGDGQWGYYIFDELQRASKAGLNIFFIFGHNHNNGWDDYLGGSSIYLGKGDTIWVSHRDSRDENNLFAPETLGFTYFNAGYTGYYTLCNPRAETTLTMTVIEIDGGEVIISRYSGDGVVNLKAPGVANDYHNESKLVDYGIDDRIYISPQVVRLGQLITLPADLDKAA